VNQRVAIKMLARLGVVADLAADGGQAIEAVRTGRYNLVLMDVEMPGVDGLTATRAIRSQFDCGAQPVIVGLTAHATTDYRELCLAAGMDGYLTKPLEPKRLSDLIEALSEPGALERSGPGRRLTVQPLTAARQPA
jgi:two-component system, sensor histidine kinase and response regulator